MSANGEEIPFVFDCDGDQLVAIVHRPARPTDTGVLILIAGGPQYRAGVGRGMVGAARSLCSAGVPVMRFDHRGLGDSEGTFLGFEYVEEDLRSAVDAFRRQVPGLENIVLWGGCDAASAAMIHGWKVAGIGSLIVANPWVWTVETQAAVLRQHYLARLGEWSFWRKLLRFEYNLTDYLRAGVRRLVTRLRSLGQRSVHPRSEGAGEEPQQDFVARMLAGLQRFQGPVLFLMSGQSMLTQEFDELVHSHPGWREVYHRPAYRRIDFPDADQTFSTREAREQANAAVRDWVGEQQRARGG